MNTDSDEPQIVQPSIKLLSSHQPLTRIVVMALVQRWVRVLVQRWVRVLVQRWVEVLI